MVGNRILAQNSYASIERAYPSNDAPKIVVIQTGTGGNACCWRSDLVDLTATPPLVIQELGDGLIRVEENGLRIERVTDLDRIGDQVWTTYRYTYGSGKAEPLGRGVKNVVTPTGRGEQYPSDILGDPSLRAPLLSLIGRDHYAAFRQTFGLGRVKTIDGRYVIGSGCQPHACCLNYSVFVLDTVQGKAWALAAQSKDCRPGTETVEMWGTLFPEDLVPRRELERWLAEKRIGWARVSVSARGHPTAQDQPRYGARRPDQVGPSFDCGAKPVATQPLAQMICKSRELAYTELSYVIAYQALREASTPAERKGMVDEANGLVNGIIDQCSIAKSGVLPGAPTDANVQCVKAHFTRQRVELISRAAGPARDEAILDPPETIAIQRALQGKSYLPASAEIDGVFGPVTRQAIAAWQKDNRLQETGFGSRVMLAALAGGPQASTAPPPPAPTPTPPISPIWPVDRSGKTSSIRLALADGPDLRAQDVFEQVSASVYVVRTDKALGSAVAISDRELLTNCHVVRGAAAVTIEREGARLPATLSSANPDADRCVLRISDSAEGLPKWTRVRPYADVKVGERVFTIGTPRGLELSLAEGLVSSKRALEEGRLIQTSAPISHGSSGGGLFDAHGHLVGITTFMLKDSQNLNFAIAAEEYAK
jgi:S1-C subfamily serine protease